MTIADDSQDPADVSRLGRAIRVLNDTRSVALLVAWFLVTCSCAVRMASPGSDSVAPATSFDATVPITPGGG